MVDHVCQEQEFVQKQQQELDGSLKKIIQQQKAELANIERECLNNKQQLMRGMWEFTVCAHTSVPQKYCKGLDALPLLGWQRER